MFNFNFCIVGLIRQWIMLFQRLTHIVITTEKYVRRKGGQSIVKP